MNTLRYVIHAVLVLFLAVVSSVAQTAQLSPAPPSPNPSQPVNVRVDDLESRMTLEEKASQRLQVPAYDWWNEALHGVANAGIATVFPEPTHPHVFPEPTHPTDCDSSTGEGTSAMP